MTRLRILCMAAGWATGAGYEGFGATAGGDRFAVVKVTSLADKGPGTLREAVQKGGRRIVFAKSGTVTLKKTLKNTTTSPYIRPHGGILISRFCLIMPSISPITLTRLCS